VTPYQLGFFGAGATSIDDAAVPERTELDAGAWVEVRRRWLLGADTLCEELISTVAWEQHRRWMYERLVDEPRLTWRRGESGELPHDALKLVGEELERLYHVPLAGPGLNYYRDGRDSVAFHADRELKHLSDTIVAILTLGSARPFLVRPAGGGRSHDFRPASGDLLVMGGACQALFEHAVPKVAASGPRISASWRWAGEAKPAVPSRALGGLNGWALVADLAVRVDAAVAVQQARAAIKGQHYFDPGAAVRGRRHADVAPVRGDHAFDDGQAQA
jgi:alkylated DNA repair dioxygenase AlkB